MENLQRALNVVSSRLTLWLISIFVFERRVQIGGGERLRSRRYQKVIPMKMLFVVVPSLLLFCGCAVTQDRDVRAYNACLLRNPNETALCDAPREAYRPD